MWQPFETLFRFFDVGRAKRNIERALALYLRGEVRRDGLQLIATSSRLQIRWRARDIHPWDRGLVSGPERQVLFVEQLLKDTETAINRLFQALPAVDVLDVTVLEFSSDRAIMAGSAARSMLPHTRGLTSVRMRLLQLGITCYCTGFYGLAYQSESADEEFIQAGR